MARDHDVSKAALCNWKSKYNGMEVSLVERLHELEAEYRRLKQMYAEIALDNKTPKEPPLCWSERFSMAGKSILTSMKQKRPPRRGSLHMNVVMSYRPIPS